MSSKIREYFANKENRIKCGITGGTIALAVIIFVGMVFMEENETQNNSIETVSQTESDTQTEEETGYSFDAGDLYDMRLDAQTIEDYYMKSCGDQFNLYTIDEDGVLWGSGHNEYAQIGLGYADEEFHEEKSKIAEHVVHVDYSQKDFVVYLTEEGKLYGLGNDSTYMLLQHTEMPVEDLAYPTKRYVTSPALLLEDVSYARCGRDDVVALKKDGTVWTWGMIWNYQSTGYCITMPQQILTDVKMITGGWFNHAALKEDGTLWTWGYNFSGNCGTDKATMIETPVQVAEDVQRVWTGLLNYSAKEDDITDMEEFGNDYVDNTIIEKTDGTFYACGMGVGDKSVVLPQYYEVSELDTVCSSEFLPLDWDEEMLNRKQREYIERKESQSEEAVLARKNEALLEEIDKNYDMEKLKRKVPRFSEDDKINETYYNAIKTLDTTGFLPDGRYCFYIEQDGRTDVERFQEQRAQHYSPERVAVADVDDDGTAELLFFIEGTCVRDSAEYVYRYSEEKNAFELEFEYSAGCNYYQNGVIKAKPLYSGFIYQDDFWPYSVFQYDENKNEFVLTASVEEIPKAPENPDNFPEEYDKDGDGKVYIISQGESVAYMDEKEYLAWEKQVFWMPEMKIDWCELGSNKELLEEIDKNYDMEKLKRKVPRFSEDDKINEAYYNAIKTLDTTGFLPDGRYCFWYYDEPENYLETKEKLGGFGIAVCDVDVDGKKEMLIGLRKELSEPYGVLIYRYNEEQRKFEVENGFSSRINFYNNGYVEEYWTMPNYDQPAFTIYQYNPALDTFEKMFWINGIEDVGIDDYFPTEQDLDGNGKGYIMSVDGKETYVDDAAYQKMMEQYIDLNKRIDVEWVDFFEPEDMTE
jgi:alpha-tubulin suppressor-like RCC1 family protein